MLPVQAPFDSSYAIGEKVESIREKFEKAGFKNIVLKESSTGWFESGSVTLVTIDSASVFKKGTDFEKDVNVEITYSSDNRCFATELLIDWQRTKYDALVEKLEKAGFKNISTVESPTDIQENDKLVTAVSLNGIDFTNEYCYIPLDAPVKISYQIYKISIGSNSSDLIGQEYKPVVADLQKIGFTNVSTQEITTGWNKPNTIVSVSVNNNENFSSNNLFTPDTKIVVKFSSEGRTDVTEIFEKWSKTDYLTFQSELNKKGIKNIKTFEKITSNKNDNKHIHIVTIDNNNYAYGNCYLRKDAQVVIEYFTTKLNAGRKASDFEDTQYKEVVDSLRERGFTNIQLYRANDLKIGVLKTEGTISSISIDDNSDFTENDTFYLNAPIKIIVHTFKNKGCEDIKQIAD